MADNNYKYIWRCAKCSHHFVNIREMDGLIKQEKKCPKCKSVNLLTLVNGQINIQCKCYDPNLDNYNYQEGSGELPYPD